MKKQKQDWHDLSVAQNEILFGINNEKQDLENLLGFHAYISDNVRLDLLEEAWNMILEYHDALRIRIKRLGTKKQYLKPYVYEKLSVKNVNGFNEFLQIEKEERSKAIRLCKGPLYRAILVDCGNGTGGMIVCIHNVAVDGYSLGLIFQQLEDYYLGALIGNPVVPKKKYSYLDYIKKESSYFDSKAAKEDYNWWKKQYEALDFKSFSLPVPRKSRAIETELKSITIEKDQYQQLNQFCNENGCSISSVVMTMIAICIYKMTGKICFIMCNLSHGRRTYALKQTVGCMVQWNTVLFNLNVNQTFKEITKENYMKYLQFLQHGRMASMKHIWLLVINACKKGFFKFWKLWPWMMYSPMELGDFSKNSKLGLECFDESELITQFYAAVYDMPNYSCLQIDLNYLSDVFSQEQINKIADGYLNVQRKCFNHMDIPIAELFSSVK